MRSMRDLLTDFSEMGARHNFLMNSGQECEGWVVSVEDDHILFVDCDAGGDKDEIKVLFRAIDISSLAYRDDDKRCWMSVRWDEAQGKWNYAVLSQDPDPEEVQKQTQNHSKLAKVKQLLKPVSPARSTTPSATQAATQAVAPSSLTSSFTRLSH